MLNVPVLRGTHDRGFNFRQSTHILHVFRFASNNTAVRNERQRYPYIALLGDFSGLQKISVITNSHTTQLSKHLQFITLPHVHVVTLTTSAWRRQHRFLSELSFLICCRTRGHLQETYTRMSVLLIYSTNHSCWYFFSIYFYLQALVVFISKRVLTFETSFSRFSMYMLIC